MKKSLVIVFVMMVLSVGIFLWGGRYVNQGRDKVEITEQVLYGNRSEAEGIVFRVDTEWNRRLLWSTEYTIGEDTQPNTDFLFCLKRVEFPSKVQESEVEIRIPGNFVVGDALSSSLDLDKQDIWFVEAFREVADRTQAGEARKEEIYLADYYDYYPLDIEIRDTKIYDMIVPEDADKIVSEYFQIPIPPDHKVEIGITKNLQGEIMELSYYTIEGGIYIWAEGVIKDSSYYFSFACYDMENRPIDNNFVKNEYGIYVIPFEWVKTLTKPNQYVMLDYENISCVYPLEIENGHIGQVVRLKADEDNNRFFLVTREKDRLVLTVVQEKTWNTIQRIELLDWEEESYFQELEIEGDCLLLSMEDGRFSFLVQDENGIYHEKLQGNFSNVGFEEITVYPMRNHVFAWDGERLAIAGFQNKLENSIYLAVYKMEGMVFLGFYEHSGDIDLKLKTNMSLIKPRGELGLQVWMRE